ncbi:DUF1802 family protein [Leptolyngbya sp. NIES-2104]|uniref:DUF1802 family protein n=1 Tax=Leptolyngbya sp. NIES-2104 TaxID=1552121 RepID=UPI0006EC5109|nr:DUF1802 family protein [Leptolyngbya sp. NIES-2104]GAP95794.1 hypothetical protein NIES2104_23190 [Leptolyngbya sp. NIES-2104]
MKHALKEWSIAIQALEQGESILLLRKGGIREEKGRFEVPFRQVLLYPTFEHQDPELLKQSHFVDRVESGWHPKTIDISSYAEITDVLQVSDPDVVRSLLPFHIWNDRFVEERLKWKPRSSLYLLLLKVFRLPQTHTIPYLDAYGGCRSWIEIDELSIENATSVLSETEYQERVRQIRDIALESAIVG